MKVLEPFLGGFYSSLTAAVEELPESEAANPLAELDLDGRIFFLLLLEILNGSAEPSALADLLGPNVASRLTSIWSSLSSAPSPDFASLRSALPNQSTDLPPLPESQTEPTVLPYTQSIFTQHLSSVHVSVAPDSTLATLPNKLKEDSVFADGRGWQNPKPALPTHLGGPAPVALDYRAKKKRDRKEQRFMAQMQKSAASLTGAFGATLKPQTIPAVGKRSKAAINERAAAAAKDARSGAATPASGTATPTGSAGGKKEAKPKALSSKDKLIAEHALKKVQEEGKENFKWWLERLEDLKEFPLPGQVSVLEAYLKNKRANDPWLRTEMIVKRLDVELRRWIADERREVDETADAYRVFIAKTVSPLLSNYVRAQQDGRTDVVINEKQGRAITTTLFVTGLECLIPRELMDKKSGIKFGGTAGDEEKKSKKGEKEEEDGGKKKKGSAKPGSKSAQAKVRPLSPSFSLYRPSLTPVSHTGQGGEALQVVQGREGRARQALVPLLLTH